MRSYEESCALLDGIVGRCIREADFAERVLADPEAALREYQLEEHELDDFRELKKDHREEAAEGWRTIRERMTAHQSQRSREAK
jgi:hypothetical protein